MGQRIKGVPGENKISVRRGVTAVCAEGDIWSPHICRDS